MARPPYVHSPRAEPDIDPKWIAIGVIVGAVGLKGAVRLKSFTDDLAAVLSRGPVTLFPDLRGGGVTHDGQVMHPTRGGYACRLSSIVDRNQAEALKGLKLYVLRDSLPDIAADDSYYYEDMRGLVARDPAGRDFGIVEAVYNFGAGDVIEIRLTDEATEDTKMYPFRDAVVPVVDIKAGFLVINREKGES